MTSLRLKSTRYAHVGKDWTYITDRVLVIPFPSTEREVREIASMLDTEHPGHYMIFNLSGKKYSANKFTGPIIEYPLQRGEPPTVKQLYDFVDQVYKWLDKNPLNIIVVHCKGKRKDRTAVMVSAWLVSSGYCTSTSEAMQVVGKMLVPLDYPSQIRYLKYYGKSLKSGVPDKDRFIFLHKIRFNTIPNFKFTGGCDPYFSIYQQGQKIFFSKKLKGAKGKTVVDFGCRDISIGGDIKIDFFSNTARKMMFSLTFNTSFEEMTGHRMILYKRDLEGACDDNDNKKFYANFKLELFFITQEKMREVRKKQRELGEFGDDLPLMDDGVNDDEISYSESGREGREKKEKVRAEVGRAICSACRNHIFDEESSISLGPRELVHWACLRCGKCSQLLASLGGSGQCVVQGGRVVCDACQEGFWPKCQECHLPVTQQNVVSFGDLVWHPQCAGCQSCKTLQTDLTRPEFHVKKKQIYCHHCAVMSPLADDRIEDYTLTPRQEELLFTIQDGTAARHFDEYLRRTHADENVEFWRDVERYKVLPSAELRTRKAEEIANKYLSPTCIKPINVDASTRDKVLARVSSGDHELFDEAQRAVFTMLELDAYNKYVSSPEYQRYLEALREEPDPEGEAEMHIIEVVEAQLNKDEPFWGTDSESERSFETPRATPRETLRETPREAPKPVSVEPKPVPQVKVEPESPKTVVESPKPEPVRQVTPPPPQPKEDLAPVLEDLSKFSINLGPKCGICSVSIGDDKHLEYKGVTYHWECFRCVHCNKQLGTETFFEKEPSKFYCLEDYNSMFAPKCGTCNRQLTGRHLTFLGKKYHLECLCCSNCKINLSNQKFFSIDGAPYCQNCVNSMSM